MKITIELKQEDAYQQAYMLNQIFGEKLAKYVFIAIDFVGYGEEYPIGEYDEPSAIVKVEKGDEQ